MRGLAWGLLFLGILAVSQSAQAAGFDCAKASTPVEKAICADPELSRLDGEMTERYWATYQSLDSFAQRDFQDSQLNWLGLRPQFCRYDNPKEANQQIPCLRRETQRRIGQLKAVGESGKTVILEDSAATQQLCSVLLDKQNIIWLETSSFFLRYLAQPKLLEQLVIAGQPLRLPNINSAHFDFLNAGHPNAVVKVAVDEPFDGWRLAWQVHWYIAIAPGERAKVEQEIKVARADRFIESFDRLADDLQYQPDPNDVWPYNRSKSWPPKPPPSLKSRLVDFGPDSSSIVFSVGATTFILVTNDQSIGAIFRPRASGEVDLLCYHRPPFGRTRESIVKNFAKADLCPIGHKKVPTARRPTDNWLQELTTWELTVFLNGWGGNRTFGFSPAGFYFSEPNNPNVELDTSWAPLEKIKRPPNDDGSVFFMLTDQGGFFASRDGLESSRRQNKPRTTTYYYIENNGLTPVCVGADIPPPGYAIR